MTAAPTPVARNRPERVAGVLLMALGTATMLGWVTRHPALFEIVHGLVPMVFNTGASFFLSGAALCLSSTEIAGGRTVRQVICLMLASLAVVVLAELALDHALGVDLVSLHAWYDYGNTRPGRMAPNTALAFLLISLGLLASDRVRGRKTAALTVALTFAVMTLGLVGLVGYAMAPDVLFGWARSARMAVHTATGIIVAAAGLWVSWSRSTWYVSERHFDEGQKIRFVSAAVLVIVAITAGLSGFVLLQRSFEASLEDRLSTIALNRGPWLHAVVQELFNSTRRAAQAAGLPMAGRLPEPAPAPVDLDESARNLLRAGYRSVRYKDASGKVLATYGSVSGSADFDAPLDLAGRSALVWNRELRVRTRHLLASKAAMTLPAEQVEIESAESRIAPLLFGVDTLGATAQVTACQRQGDMLVCLPDAFHTATFTVPVRRAPEQPLPMQRALDGTGSGIVHGLDYRSHNVIAAYSTLAPGLGFVAKQDAVEAYAPIRRALTLGAPVIALLAIVGAAVMYLQLNPLVHRMRRSEQETAAALARNLAVREAVSDGILTFGEDGCIESSNAAAYGMLGYADGELVGRDFFALLAKRTRAQLREDFDSSVRNGELTALGLRNQELDGVRSDGSEFPLELTLNAIPQATKKTFVAVIRDITSRRRTETILFRMAKFDALTGLPNRALFHDRLRTALARATRSRNPLALMFLDLDGFKAINDQYGHAAGDQLLRQVAIRLSSVVRKTDTVARLAGDEFTILLENLVDGNADAERVADKAVGAIQASFEVEAHQLHVTVSVGLVVYDPRVEGVVEMSDLLKRADQSMYRVKRSGKNGFALAAL